jgi:hypothetical protein
VRDGAHGVRCHDGQRDDLEELACDSRREMFPRDREHGRMHVEPDSIVATATKRRSRGVAHRIDGSRNVCSS